MFNRKFPRIIITALCIACACVCIASAADKTDTSRSLQDFSYVEFHGLQVIVIESDRSVDELNASKDNAGSGTICCIDENKQTVYDGSLKSIKGRGNTSWDMVKDQKPYNIKLDKKVALIPDAAESKKYCLLCGLSYNETAKEVWVGENSVLAVLTGFKLYEEVGGNYSIKSVPVELYINGDYRGVYVLCEAVQIGEGRVDIKESEYTVEGTLTVTEKIKVKSNGKTVETECRYSPDTVLADSDASGGFILEFDNSTLYSEDCYFVTAMNNTFYFKDPDMPSKEQVLAIAQYVQDWEDAVYSDTGYNSKGKYYTDYFDIESNALEFAVKYVTTDGDIYRKSTYFAIDVDDAGAFKKIESGPAWDFDSCNYGRDTTYAIKASQLYYRILLCKLCQHSEFYDAVDKIITGKVKTAMNKLASSGGYIEQLNSKLATAMAANLKRWPDSMNFGADENTAYSAKKFLKNYKYHINRFYSEIWQSEYLNKFFSMMQTVSDYFDEFSKDLNSFTFTDVSTNAYYHSSVCWAAKNLICNGSGGQKLSPNSKCTKGEALNYIYRANAYPEHDSKHMFSDISEDSVYYDMACWISRFSNLDLRCEMTTDWEIPLNPDQTITRGEFIYYLWLLVGSPSADTSNNFKDIPADAYYAQAAAWAKSRNISTGTGNNCFNPDSYITRADVLVMLERYF